MRYEHRFYRSRSGLRKALARWRRDVIHWFSTGHKGVTGYMLLRRVP